jgi:hypothetical protein
MIIIRESILNLTISKYTLKSFLYVSMHCSVNYYIDTCIEVNNTNTSEHEYLRAEGHGAVSIVIVDYQYQLQYVHFQIFIEREFYDL